MFQSLIGRLKTTKERGEIKCQKKVSIPYRQAKNLNVNECKSEYGLFQSLIGRLKTFLNLIPFCSLRQFQSLIGRLKTKVSKFLSPPIIPVSIPYRQAKNYVYMVNVFGLLQVSIPYRQAKNQDDLIYPNLITSVSIPYRQAKNQKALDFYRSIFTSFNPLQVG